MEFRFEPIPAGTLLSTETRILATDPGTRRSFGAYWFLIRPSSSAIRREVLAVVARRAELSRSQNINGPAACPVPPGAAPLRDRPYTYTRTKVQMQVQSVIGPLSHPPSGPHIGAT